MESLLWGWDGVETESGQGTVSGENWRIYHACAKGKEEFTLGLEGEH